MTARRLATAAAGILVNGALLGALTGCVPQAAAGPTTPRPVPAQGPFGVESLCDQFGNRIYRNVTGSTTPIAVVPDRDCPRTAGAGG